jgi:hypothetical protein
MRVHGEDVASSVREWVKDDIKKGPSSRYELGKFFFGVSTGTLGLFAGLLKFATPVPSLDALTISCFAALLFSMLVAIYMATPIVTRISRDIELYSEYNRIVLLVVKFIVLWFGLWVIGFILGAIKLFQ